MRFAVLAPPDSWHLNDLRRAGEGVHEICPIAFARIGSLLEDDRCCEVVSGDRGLAEFDAVLVRTMPAGTLEQVVFRMDALGRVEAAGCVVINPARAIEAAVDKYLASAKLHAAGLPTPRTFVCQTADAALDGFRQLGGDVVVKPLFGGEGRGMTRVCDPALADRAFRLLAQLGAVIYLQEFIPHEGFDLRLLVLGERVLAVRRCNPNDWRTNVSRGARMTPVDPTPRLVEMALRAAQAVGAPLAGVDLLPAPGGQVYVLEVNAVPGWRALSQALRIDVAALVLDYVSLAVKNHSPQAANRPWTPR